MSVFCCQNEILMILRSIVVKINIIFDTIRNRSSLSPDKEAVTSGLLTAVLRYFGTAVRRPHDTFT